MVLRIQARATLLVVVVVAALSAVVVDGVASADSAKCTVVVENGVRKWKCPVQTDANGNTTITEPTEEDLEREEAIDKYCTEIANLDPPQTDPICAGGPTVEDLADQAAKLIDPALPPALTAPPRGTSAAVGLPLWVWVSPAYWKPITKRAAAGGLWAQAIATPSHLVIRPGNGEEVACPVGNGTPYDKTQPFDSQRSNCSYIYLRSSYGQPDSKYPMTVTVVWTATWTGSGQPNPIQLPALERTTPVPVEVAEGQALN